MKFFKYRAVAEPTLEIYREHGMEFTPDEKSFNGFLLVEAPDEDTADKIRMTYSDIRMWEKIID
jgi:hypothetical protein